LKPEPDINFFQEPNPNQTWGSIFVWNQNLNHSKVFKQLKQKVLHKTQELPNICKYQRKIST
jgi:hypothetical protein